MKVTNPLDEPIEGIIIDGVEYSVDAGETLEGVPEKHARYWQNSLHDFIELAPEEASEGEVTDPEAVEQKKAEEMVNEIIGQEDDEKTRNRLEAIAEARDIDPDEFEDDEELAAAIRGDDEDEGEEDNEDEE